MFGLHDGPSTVLKLASVVLVASLLSFVWLTITQPRFAASVRNITWGTYIFVGIVAVVVIYSAETDMRSRDADIRATLQTKGISVAGFPDDDHVTVSRDGCSAIYTIRTGVSSYRLNWPLAKGSAWQPKGCPADPDAIFIPTS